MNILFINSIGRNKFGGGEKWMVNAAKGLTDRGHNVVLASKRNSRLLDYAAGSGVRTEVMEIRGDFSPLATLKIAAWMKRHQTDILICNLNKDVRVAGLAARLVGRPVVLARHGMLLCSKKWKHKLSLTRLTDGIVTNSRTIREAYAGYGWFSENFVKVIYNGLTIPAEVTAFDFASRYPGKKIIYSAGRLSKQKGFEYLIDAAAMLKRKRDDLLFAISGEGKLEIELKNRVAALGLKGSFVFLGFTPDIYPFLKGCDLFVLASLFEGMPNVVMEAMAMQKPVIATDVNGARELMGASPESLVCDTGLIIPPKNPAAIAEAIEQIIDNPALLEAYGKAGHQRVETHFTVPIMIDNLEKHLQSKLAEKAGRC
ncbi:MAG TPA: glycosyltransferase [Chlorobaculum sp.]|uniref:Glycosyl transferase n=1 Tax=Chlorobaculum tepidum (strain ATCC 49652 / DSM 12025 / NBRC 103806 / TLS) TaxID=194439 RepID=Q8KFU7_CHLTE|nr:glycosyltransferase [Chlorobaculum tepidum]AAM71471.1 glycosyl transferase [Chlorobaculum tepidum TLS]HBU23697.1 glycosyltransferase [Chlorobaculum sp.]